MSYSLSAIIMAAFQSDHFVFVSFGGISSFSRYLRKYYYFIVALPEPAILLFWSQMTHPFLEQKGYILLHWCSDSDTIIYNGL